MARDRITAGARPPRGSVLANLMERVDQLETRVSQLEGPAAAAAAEPSPPPRPRPPRKAAKKAAPAAPKTDA